MTERWISEVLHEAVGVRTSFRADRILVESKTEHQDLVLFENQVFGRVLMLDGTTQLTTRDEFIYHEMMSHLPILAHGGAADVLIIGGGDGGIAEEVLKHRTVERLVQVEIDPGVVEFSRQYLPEVSNGAFDDPRMKLVIADGFAFAGETEERFDLLIVDSTDPVGPAKVLYTSEFHRRCKRCLKPGGVLITQAGNPFYQRGELVDSVANFAALFADARCVVAAIPTYVGGFFALGWASDDESLWAVDVETVRRRYEEAAIETRYYTPHIHRAAFALPRYIGEAMEEGQAKGRERG
ncbi:MAG TPA: polyamine aminopropyltransferase [Afifellaceae bacterium]|nr:polyamine aminopropyltransferase [Afifellaceae bacterium]